MTTRLRRHAPWIAGWLVCSALGSAVLGHRELDRVADGFDTNARAAYRLLNQRANQHDALLSTLSLLRSKADPTRPEQRLPAVYPQVVSVENRSGDMVWTRPQLVEAEAESRRLGRAVPTDLAIARGRYQLLMAGDPTSYLVQIDIRGMVPWAEWPMAVESSPVRVTLEHGGQAFVLQPGQLPEDGAGGWPLNFRQTLTSASQPFDVVAQRRIGWGELPWSHMCTWTLLVGLMLLSLRALLRQRRDSHRAHELLRLGQVARLNTLGELATGMARDLNQPVTELLSNARVAAHVLAEDPPDVLTAQLAVQDALEQAQRVADVINRLRYAVHRSEADTASEDIALQALAQRALDLLEPEFRLHGIAVDLRCEGPEFTVRGDRGAVEQILHNLLLNAMQSLDQVQISDRRLEVVLNVAGGHGHLVVRDSGPGMATDVLPRVFEPFFTTREGALGLGLPLSESLAQGMGGTLTAFNLSPHGAEFRLSLPLAAPH